MLGILLELRSVGDVDIKDLGRKGKLKVNKDS